MPSKRITHMDVAKRAGVSTAVVSYVINGGPRNTSPEVRERLVSQGAEVYTMSPTEFSAFFDRERKNWAGVVAEGGVKID